MTSPYPPGGDQPPFGQQPQQPPFGQQPDPGFAPPEPPGYWQGPAQQQGNNGKAIAALVFGILGILCFGVLAGIPAIILGQIAKREIDEGKGQGRGMAQAGFILGIVSVAWTIFWLIVFLASSS